MDAFGAIKEIQDKGLIEHIGGTHLDTKQVRQLIDEGISLKTNLIPYSIFDRRAEKTLFPLAQSSNIAIVFESPDAQGWLQEKWYRAKRPDYLELQKMEKEANIAYQVLSKAGGWEFRQALGYEVAEIAEKHCDLMKGYPVKHEHVTSQWTIKNAEEKGIQAGRVFRPTPLQPDPLAQHLIALDDDDMQKLEAISDESLRLFPPQGCIGSWEREMYKAEEGSSFFFDKRNITESG